jgi:hypothetical protein
LDEAIKSFAHKMPVFKKPKTQAPQSHPVIPPSQSQNLPGNYPQYPPSTIPNPVPINPQNYPSQNYNKNPPSYNQMVQNFANALPISKLVNPELSDPKAKNYDIEQIKKTYLKVLEDLKEEISVLNKESANLNKNSVIINETLNNFNQELGKVEIKSELLRASIKNTED